MQPRATEWGTVAEWVTVAVGFGALSAAIAAGVIAWRDHLSRLKADRERQARLVAVYEVPVQDLPDPRARQVYVRNTSQEPIYTVVIAIVLPDDVATRHFDLIIPQADPQELVACWEAVRSLLENAIADSEHGDQDWRWRHMRFPLSIAFTDAQGVHWQRLPSGKLIQRPPDSAIWDIKTAAQRDAAARDTRGA